MTVALSAFHPWVFNECPGVPAPLANDAIITAARVFLTATEAITLSISQATVAATPDYVPTVTTDTEMFKAVSLKRSATEWLTPKSQEFIDAQSSPNGTANMYCVLDTDPMSIRLSPTPDEVETLTLVVALRPATTATVLDSVLSTRYRDAVVAYACYYLMSQNNKPWTDQERAKFLYNKYDGLVADTITALSQSFAGLPSRVEMRPFA